MKFLLITTIFFLAGCATSENDKLVQIRNHQVEAHERCDRLYPGGKYLVKEVKCSKEDVIPFAQNLNFIDADILNDTYNKAIIIADKHDRGEVSKDVFVSSADLLFSEEAEKLTQRQQERDEVNQRFYQALGEMGQAMQPPASTYQKPVNCYSTSIYNDSFSCY
jgi:hypothetical protein